MAVSEHQELKMAPSPRFPLIIPRFFGSASATIPHCAEMTFVVTGRLLSLQLFFEMIVSPRRNSGARFPSGALGVTTDELRVFLTSASSCSPLRCRYDHSPTKVELMFLTRASGPHTPLIDTRLSHSSFDRLILAVSSGTSLVMSAALSQSTKLRPAKLIPIWAPSPDTGAITQFWPSTSLAAV